MARLIESVVGHTQIIDSLFQLKLQQRWPHAFLFVGPSAIGKKQLALAFAQVLICEKSDTACGICGPCLRLAKLQSENLIFIEPDTSLVKPVIKVEAIRGLLESLSLASWHGGRVVIINDAHTMNAQAANTLLKTLEEPFENVYFFLIGPDVHQFLPTIRSRAQVLQFHSLLAEDLRKIKPQLADWAYQASHGQVDRLTQLTSSDGIEKRTEAFQLLEQFFNDRDFLMHSIWRQQVKDKNWTLAAIAAWLQLFSQSLKAKATHQTGSSAVSIEHTKYFKMLEVISSQQLIDLSQSLLQAEKSILSNLDPVLIIENIWVNYGRVG